MAHEKAKGQQAENIFLGSLRASRAIKKTAFFWVPQIVWALPSDFSE